MGITWEEAEVAAHNRSVWRRSAAECIHLDVGWIKVKGQLTLVVNRPAHEGWLGWVDHDDQDMFTKQYNLVPCEGLYA